MTFQDGLPRGLYLTFFFIDLFSFLVGKLDEVSQPSCSLSLVFISSLYLCRILGLNHRRGIFSWIFIIKVPAW